MEKELKNKMNIRYTYPEPTDENFQSKIYEKREFYTNKMPERPDIKDYNDVKEFRDNKCARKFSLLEQQVFLSNFINPDTPYKGLVVFHGTGTGKTCAAIAVAEKFKDVVAKYDTKIYILVNGPLHRENWNEQLISCTGEAYSKYIDKSMYYNNEDLERMKKTALNNAKQFYKIMTFRGFYKRVLGIRVAEKVVEGDKVKTVYRKTDEGEHERDFSIDRLYNLNNTLLIVDEAHNMTGNTQGDALKKIINNSLNLKVLLLTATPMKNLADDMIDLVNFLRPANDQIQRDKVFNSYHNYQMDFKEGGIEYIKNMCRGYISYLRGADPLTFATRIEKGIIPKGLLFTKVTSCTMSTFQQKIYDTVPNDFREDTLDRKSSAAANFVFPGLTKDLNKLTGYYGNDGLATVRDQLKTYHDRLNKLITDMIGVPSEKDYIYISDVNKTITGEILKMPHLKHFSIKFYKAMKKISRLIWGKKGSQTAFVYSNLVKVGIELFQEVLLQNGYLEYQERPEDYQISKDTICYYCGRAYVDHQLDRLNTPTKRPKKMSESSTDYEKLKGNIPNHKFMPATFISVTGDKGDDTGEVIPENKKRIISDVFSNIKNKEGKMIKLVLGSRVMSEGINSKNVGEVHVLDVHYNLGKIDQVIGRAIRHCSHHNIMSEKNPYPKVNVYKYAITDKKGLSSDEDLYRKAELKYLLVKKTERILKETAVDCPLNMGSNIIPEEVAKHKHCGEKGHGPCPAICDYDKCNFVCDDKMLNAKYYDKNRGIYKRIVKDKLDITTFTNTLARTEIDYAKRKIKEMYRLKFVYELPQIVKYVYDSYRGEKRDLFDEFFVYKALDELIPITENDFNTFKDTVLDKYNRPGWLIYINKYYIFQPDDQNDDIPMHYRTIYDQPIYDKLSLIDYMKSDSKYTSGSQSTYEDDMKDSIETEVYDFNSVLYYYDNRPEFDIVGIIDKESGRKKGKALQDLKDVFKIRPKRAKILDKKRGTGIPSLKGSVCTFKDKPYIDKVAKKIGVDFKGMDSRHSVCDAIRDKMLELEKYSTGDNKKTYVIVPKNHPVYKFPLNLEDRVEYIKTQLKDTITFKLKINLKKLSVKEGEFKGRPKYVLEVEYVRELDEYMDLIKSLGGDLSDDKIIFTIE